MKVSSSLKQLMFCPSTHKLTNCTTQSLYPCFAHAQITLPPSPPHTHTHQLQPGVLELFQFLGERDIKRALVTRNSQLPANAFLKRLDEELEANKDKYPSLEQDKLFSMVSTMYSVTPACTPQETGQFPFAFM